MLKRFLRKLSMIIMSLLSLATVTCVPHNTVIQPVPVISAPAPNPIPTVVTQVDDNAAFMERIDLVVLETFPLRVNVVARVKLRDGCEKINEITQEKQNTQFIIKISTTRENLCNGAGRVVEHIIPLEVDGLKAGNYTVHVNQMNDSFELTVDNFPIPL